MREILRIDRVSQATGLSKTSVYNLMNRGQFPRPIKLTPRAAGWISTDIENWIEERIAASRAEEAARAKEDAMAKRTVAINDLGLRIGEDHPMAKLTDADVESLLRLRDETGWGYKRLARIFDVSPSQIRRIVQGVHRGQPAMGYRTVFVTDASHKAG